MSFDPTRLRRGEWIAGVGGVLLLVSLFAFDWYGFDVAFTRGLSETFLSGGANGWDAHTVLRWFMLLTVAAGIALWVLTAVERTDAIPLSAAVAAVVVALITTVCLAWRVLVNEPGPNAVLDVRFGAYVGLLSSAAVLAGAWLSLRDEDRDAPLPDIPVRRVA